MCGRESERGKKINLMEIYHNRVWQIFKLTKHTQKYEIWDNFSRSSEPQCLSKLIFNRRPHFEWIKVRFSSLHRQSDDGVWWTCKLSDSGRPAEDWSVTNPDNWQRMADAKTRLIGFDKKKVKTPINTVLSYCKLKTDYFQRRLSIRRQGALTVDSRTWSCLIYWINNNRDSDSGAFQAQVFW